MAIEKGRDHAGTTYTPTCDICGDTLPLEYEYEDAVSAIKKAGWVTLKVNGDWENYCPDCDAP